LTPHAKTDGQHGHHSKLSCVFVQRYHPGGATSLLREDVARLVARSGEAQQSLPHAPFEAI